MADIHGYYDHAEYFVEIMRRKNVDFIILVDDYVQRFGKRRASNISFSEETIKSIEAVAPLRLPICLILGNHETLEIYKEVISYLSSKYENICDLCTVPFIEKHHGLSIIGNP